MSRYRTPHSSRDVASALGGYVEWRARPDLVDTVECMWTYSCPPGVDRSWHRVLPHSGLSLCFESWRDSKGRCEAGALVILGPLAEVRSFEPRPSHQLQAIRLKPEWAPYLPGVTPADFKNQMVPCGAPPAVRLRERLLKCRSPSEALDILEREIARRARGCPPRANLVIGTTLDHFRSRRTDQYRLHDLAREVQLSERHLRRLVTDTIGFSPKAFQRIERLNRAVADADRLPDPRWSSVAYRNGYCDQAHMIRDISRLTGLTPAALHRERRREVGPPSSYTGDAPDRRLTRNRIRHRP